MKIEINIEKKHLYILIVFIVLIGVGYVIAYTSDVPNPGHGGDTVLVEVNDVEKTLQNALDSGDILNIDNYPMYYVLCVRHWQDCSNFFSGTLDDGFYSDGSDDSSVCLDSEFPTSNLDADCREIEVDHKFCMLTGVHIEKFGQCWLRKTDTGWLLRAERGSGEYGAACEISCWD